MLSAIAQQFAIERHARLTPHEREEAQGRLVERYLQAKAVEDQAAVARLVRQAAGAGAPPLPAPVVLAIVPPRWPAWVLRRHARHATAFGDHFETCQESDCVSFRL